MQKVALFEAGEWEGLPWGLSERAETVRLADALSPATAEKGKDCEIAAVFIGSRVDKPVLDRLPRLKMLAAMSTGVDHIDLAECRRRGIVVCNVPSYGEATVAEHAFALLLSACRRLDASFYRTRKGDARRQGLRGTDLRGKTVGVIGAGHIGCAFAKLATAFGMRVLAYDRRCDPELKDVVEYAEDLGTVLSKADFISLHLPLTEQTRHIINRSNISKVKRGAILVNTARGELVENAALLEALDGGRLAWAGLDVLEEAGREAVLAHPRVFATPHNAFNTEEAAGRIVEATVGNIEAFIAGRPRNVVTNV